MIVALALYATAMIIYAIYAVYAAISFATSVDTGFIFTTIVALFSWSFMMIPVGLVTWAAQPLILATGVVFEIFWWLTKKTISGIRYLINPHSRNPV